MAKVLQKDCPLARPPLKWAGGKRWLLPHLWTIWQKHRDRRLIEPFCGGVSITLGLAPSRALLNDINSHAINFYRWLQKGLLITSDMQNNSEFYYLSRQRFNKLVKCGRENSKEAAELFYFLNRTGYNGLCRFNGRGEFNVPFGSYKSINYRSDFREYKKVMANWQFSSGDFQSLQIDAEDFIYADPPYDVEFTRYAKEDFTWLDQIRLAQWLSRHSGPVVLSNQATPRIIALYQELDFDLRFFEAPRMISCTGDRTRAKEVLATKGL